jgi:hypothetical protein
MLSTLPKLTDLDLTANAIRTLPKILTNMIKWRDAVIECLLPGQVALLDATFASTLKLDNLPTEAWPETKKLDEKDSVRDQVDVKMDLAVDATNSDIIDDGECVTVKLDGLVKSVERSMTPKQSDEESKQDEASNDINHAIPEQHQNHANETTEQPLKDGKANDIIGDKAHVSEPTSNIQTTPLPETIPDEPSIVAFQSLEVLSLESNKLSSPETFEILGAMPR